MYDQHRELESSLRDVSKWVGRTLKVLTNSGSPAAQTYLAATRAIGTLHAAWSRHLDIERAMFPAERLQRIVEVNASIEKQLEAILAASWPRSPQAGLQSMRIGVIKVLTLLLAQIETERATILPAMLRMDRMELVVAAHVDSDVSELLAI